MRLIGETANHQPLSNTIAIDDFTWKFFKAARDGGFDWPLVHGWLRNKKGSRAFIAHSVKEKKDTRKTKDLRCLICGHWENPRSNARIQLTMSMVFWTCSRSKIPKWWIPIQFGDRFWLRWIITWKRGVSRTSKTAVHESLGSVSVHIKLIYVKLIII